MLTARRLFALGVLACVGLLGVALYLQHVEYLEPCPLCIVQRALVIVLALVMAIAAIHDPKGKGRRAYGAAVAVVALLGAAVAGRHVYLQTCPPTDSGVWPGTGIHPGCLSDRRGARLDSEGFRGVCRSAMAFLGLTIPGWTLVVFTGFAALGVLSCVFRSVASAGATIPGWRSAINELRTTSTGNYLAYEY